jgi:ABC-type microcin C transport system duplicated ATPase subunit YejF
MVFQEPMSSLNPVYTIGDQIADAVMLHRTEALKLAEGMLARRCLSPMSRPPRWMSPCRRSYWS